MSGLRPASAGIPVPGLPLELRPAELQDAGTLLSWRNLDEIVALGSTQTRVTPAEHDRWLRSVLEDRHRLLFVVERDGEPIGQVRFDPENGADACAVSVYLVGGNVGRGYGGPVIDAACAEAFDALGVERLVARVRAGNERSLRAFERVGFTLSCSTAEETTLVRPRPAPVPHNRLTVDEADVAAVAAVVASGRWAGGEQVRRLEERLCEVAAVDHAVCVASGSSALRLALQSLGVGPGGRVAVPAYSCVALANAVLATGAEIVPVDVATGTWNLDAAGVGATRASAVIAVHTFGLPADTEALRRGGVPMVEDCAHALGLTTAGGPLGSLGDVAVTSFYATKLVGAGEGGAVLTNSADVAGQVRDWRDYDDRPPDAARLNHRLTDLEAALALSQLSRLESMVAARRRAAEAYSEMLGPVAARTAAFELPEATRPRVWYRYTIRVADGAERWIEALARRGIRSASPVSDWRSGSGEPVADDAYARLVSLPLYPTITAEEQRRVAAAVGAVAYRAGRT